MNSSKLFGRLKISTLNVRDSTPFLNKFLASFFIVVFGFRGVSAAFS
jgi:hypothetical protein